MIITTEVLINAWSKNKYFYENKGYDISLRYIMVKVSDLPKSSRQIISVKCDVCGKKRDMDFGSYNNNTKNETEIYTCHKCCTTKRKKTFLERYGSDCALKIENFKNKSKQTKIKKYYEKNYKH